MKTIDLFIDNRIFIYKTPGQKDFPLWHQETVVKVWSLKFTTVITTWTKVLYENTKKRILSLLFLRQKETLITTSLICASVLTSESRVGHLQMQIVEEEKITRWKPKTEIVQDSNLQIYLFTASATTHYYINHYRTNSTTGPLSACHESEALVKTLSIQTDLS